MNGKMTAAVLYGKEDVKIEKVPIPRVGDGEVLVKVQVALTCGTDLKVYQRGYHARMIVPPALFGHELAGVIEEVGHGVRGFKKGMRVVALNSAPCQMCFYCSKHQENLCEDLLFNNGAYAEYIRIPRRIVETNMLAVPGDVSYEEAAMVEPLACVLRGLHETGVEIGDTVTVIGGGPDRPHVRAGGQGHRMQRDFGGETRLTSGGRQADGRARSGADHQSERRSRGRAHDFARKARQ